MGFEVKASSAVAIQDFKNLRWFSDNVVRDRRHFVGIVIYLGAHALSFGSNLFALPLSIFGSFK